MGTLLCPSLALQYIQHSLKQSNLNADYDDSFGFAVMAFLLVTLAAAVTVLSL